MISAVTWRLLPRCCVFSIFRNCWSCGNLHTQQLPEVTEFVGGNALLLREIRVRWSAATDTTTLFLPWWSEKHVSMHCSTPLSQEQDPEAQTSLISLIYKVFQPTDFLLTRILFLFLHHSVLFWLGTKSRTGHTFSSFWCLIWTLTLGLNQHDVFHGAAATRSTE